MKKLLNSLYILDDTVYLSLEGENIVCKSDEKEKFRLPFTNIEDIYCFSYLGCSPALMGKCVESGIPINFISPQGKFLARVDGEIKGNVYLRKAQFDMFGNSTITLAQNTVATKISNTRSLIKRSLRDNPEIDNDSCITDCMNYLQNGIKTVYDVTDIETLMGVEGNCAKSYFDIFDKLILQQKDSFKLINRSKRPPLDNVNAMLSFLYSVATNAYASALASVGLDSYYGFFHSLRSGRNSLACDLVEEFRCIIERLVLTMINLKQINNSDFEKQVSGAVFLNDDGKKKVLTCWQAKKREIITHPYLKEKMPIGLLPFVQSSLLAKYIRGEIEEYPNFLVK